MKIGELARSAGAEVETLRFYEREGLLSEPLRNASGYRIYQAQHLSELNFILHCRSLNMSLAEIRQLAHYRNNPALGCVQTNEMIDRHIDNVHQQIENLKRLEQQLIMLRERCPDGHHNSDNCGILKSLVAAAEGEPCACHPDDHTNNKGTNNPATQIK
ncbi:MAG: Cd(II)/Pb(II)-responsive transcriptional regulator [Plesiomonas sp.]